jgi:hypothetical protein
MPTRWSTPPFSSAANELKADMPSAALEFVSKSAPPPPDTALMGLAKLMTLAFRGVDLTPLAQRLMERASLNEGDANALMDLSTILFLRELKDAGKAVQAQALGVTRRYEMRSALPTALRLLAIMTAGDLMTNAPLPFLLEESDVALTLLYVLPGEPLPDDLPPHDVLIVAISQSEHTRELLASVGASLAERRASVLNAPARIAVTCRSMAYRQVDGIPGLVMPATTRASRSELLEMLLGGGAPSGLLPGGAYPLILRPVDSHAGHGLDKICDPRELADYLHRSPDTDFFMSRFVDYRSPDGLFRKYRVVLIDGTPFAAHMGVSAHWMIHYLNAGMSDSTEKRAEEERFMRSFDHGFARTHGAALAQLSQRCGLDYLVIDCAETTAGELLVFEIDPGAVVHSMDPVELFPYKRAFMDRIYRAFDAMLHSAAGQRQ